MNTQTEQHSEQGQAGPGQHGAHDTGHGQEITIIINGREKTVEKGDYSFDQIVKLAFDPIPTGPNLVFTITYRRGHGDKPLGNLDEGQSVKVKDGMIFNVKVTDKS